MKNRLQQDFDQISRFGALGIDIRDTHPRDKEKAVSVVKTLISQIAEKRG